MLVEPTIAYNLKISRYVVKNISAKRCFYSGRYYIILRKCVNITIHILQSKMDYFVLCYSV